MKFRNKNTILTLRKNQKNSFEISTRIQPNLQFLVSRHLNRHPKMKMPRKSMIYKALSLIVVIPLGLEPRTPTLKV